MSQCILVSISSKPSIYVVNLQFLQGFTSSLFPVMLPEITTVSNHPGSFPTAGTNNKNPCTCESITNWQIIFEKKEWNTHSISSNCMVFKTVNTPMIWQYWKVSSSTDELHCRKSLTIRSPSFQFNLRQKTASGKKAFPPWGRATVEICLWNPIARVRDSMEILQRN